MVLGNVLAVVTNNLEPADHLANGEEAEALGSHDTTSNQLSAVDVSELLQHGRGLLRGLGGGLRESTGVSNGVQDVLVVALESLHGTITKVSINAYVNDHDCQLTAGTSSGCGRQSWQAQSQHAPSREPGEFVLCV